jgi:hypothetical protein
MNRCVGLAATSHAAASLTSGLPIRPIIRRNTRMPPQAHDL